MYKDSNANPQQREYYAGRYEIIEPVGRGRNSVVYKAQRLPDPERAYRLGWDICALKVVIENVKDPRAAAVRVRKEAIALLSCVHENVIRLSDYVAEEGNSFLALEYAEKGDLRSLIESGSVDLDPKAVVRLVVQVLSGLEAIHRAGIIHRDIKPENLLLSADCVVKIADFGIATFKNEKINKDDANRGVGTFEYLAPETLEEGICDELTDVYSVAVCLYQLLTGVIPFGEGSFAEQIDNKMNSTIVPLRQRVPEASERLQAVVHKALQSERDNRYTSLSEFKALLQSFLPDEPSAPHIKSISTVRAEEQIVSIVPAPALDDQESLEGSHVKESLELGETEGRDSLMGRIVGANSVGILAIVILMLSFIFLSPGDESPAIAAVSNISHPADLDQSVGGTFAEISSGFHSGRILNLNDEEQEVSFYVRELTDVNKVLISVNVNGWQPQLFEKEVLQSENRLVLSSGGMTLELTTANSDDERFQSLGGEKGLIRGLYRDKASGRTGNWLLN